MPPPIKQPSLVLLACLCTLVLLATAAEQPAGISTDAALLDSYLLLTAPQVSLSPKQSGREGRTSLTLQLTQQNVAQYMPTSSPQVQGMTFDVLNTWEALKSMALAYRGADAANSRSAPDSPPVFPRSSLAARTASIAPPPAEASTAAAAAPPPRQPFVSLPPALMMVPFGSSTAAIADVMDVTYEEAAGAITLQLDVVHQPVVFSQFVPHVGGRRHSDSDTTAAHYHFATRPGMTVDAAGLLTGLQESNYKPEGLHVFLKTEPLQLCTVTGSMSPATATLNVGATLAVTVSDLTQTCGTIVNVWTNAFVTLALTGPGNITAVSEPPAREPNSPPGMEQPARRQPQEVVAYATNGQASFVVQALALGTITVQATEYVSPKRGAEFRDNLPTITIQVVPAIATVLLLPHKAYRRCGDPLLLTGVARDSTGNPVSGATIVFAVHGDCTPDYASVAVTNARGEVHVKMGSREPGSVVVVAAAAQGAGGVVKSEPAYIDFFENKHDDERGHDYERYEHEAAKLAEQRALGAPVATST